MSHPDPKHDPENVYPSDGYRSGTGGLSKKTQKTLGISEMFTSDLKGSIKAGKKNAKNKALEKFIGKKSEYSHTKTGNFMKIHKLDRI